MSVVTFSISSLSEASLRKSSFLLSDQKKGCNAISCAVGLHRMTALGQKYADVEREEAWRYRFVGLCSIIEKTRSLASGEREG